MSRGTGVGMVKEISKCNGGLAVPKTLKMSKTFAYPVLTNKSLIHQLKIIFIDYYTSITWAAVHNLHMYNYKMITL